MRSLGLVQPTGDLGITIKRRFSNEGTGLGRELSASEVLHFGAPQRGLPEEVNEWRLGNLRYLWSGVRRVAASRILRLPHFYGQLWGRIFRADGSVVDLGLLSMRVVTDAGVGFIVDAFQNSTELENMKFHAIGTGSTAEASSETALVTELTTQYNPDNTRATGTTVEGATANIYRTVGTNTVDASVNLREHGILSQAATGGGTLLDRSLFNSINLDSGDSIETTYELTLNAGG